MPAPVATISIDICDLSNRRRVSGLGVLILFFLNQPGRYAFLFRPTHLIGLEFSVSIASAALRNEPTGAI